MHNNIMQVCRYLRRHMLAPSARVSCQEDVGRLDVAVEDSGLMQGFQTLGDALQRNQRDDQPCLIYLHGAVKEDSETNETQKEMEEEKMEEVEMEEEMEMEEVEQTETHEMQAMKSSIVRSRRLRCQAARQCFTCRMCSLTGSRANQRTYSSTWPPFPACCRSALPFSVPA